MDRHIICDACALPVSPAIDEDVEMFLEQAAIAVGTAFLA